ncbi:MAG: hypothetical protein WD077_00425 [Bacteroidia bacterium]
MRYLKLMGLAFFFLLSSCVSDMNFGEPQPKNDRDERKFKNKFQGKYLCLADSSILTIGNKTLIQEWNIKVHLAKSFIDSAEGHDLKDGLLYSKGIETPLPVDIMGDTVVATWQHEKEIFNISEEQVLRHYKGIYFLNYKHADQEWTVKIMKTGKDGTLSIKRIYGGDEEIEELQKLTEVEEIADEKGKVVNLKIQPTRKELKGILAADLFKEGTIFKKLKE